jgi:hypothetical protein
MRKTLPTRHRSGIAARWVALAAVVVAAGCSKTSAPRDKPAGLPPSGLPPPPPPTPAPGSGEPEMVPAAPAARETISGTIVLPAAHRAAVKKGDTIFLVARKSDGPGGLLAVQRLQAGDFPMPFTLSNRDAMIPGTAFEGPIAITVRVDKDGDPITRRKGDVFGQASGIKVGAQDVKVSLDTVQKEDVTLSGPAGAMPQGHGMPPGHP